MAQFIRELKGNTSYWTIDVSGMDEVIKAVARYGREVEKELNKELHGNIGKQMKREIKERMPVSDRKKPAGKRHARGTRSLKQIEHNLYVRIKPYPAYRYLVFPDLAIGTSFKNKPQHFFKNSLQENGDKILERLNEAIARGIVKSHNN